MWEIAKRYKNSDLLLLDSEASGEVEAGVRRVWIFEAAGFSRVDSSQQRVLIIFMIVLTVLGDIDDHLKRRGDIDDGSRLEQHHCGGGEGANQQI